MREPDYELVRELHDKYKPFCFEVADFAEGAKCDFCRGGCTRVLIAKAQSNDISTIWACYENGCASAFAGKETATMCLFQVGDVRHAVAAGESGWSREGIDAFLGVEGKGKPLVVETTVAPDDDRTLAELVAEADTYWMHGVCGWWRLVPKLVEAFVIRKSLSPKQKNVLVRYVRACEETVDKGD